jgi:YfiH family protein
VNDGSVYPVAIPSRTVADGRLSLAYSCLEYPWLAHGTAVFKDLGYESRDSAWRQLVAGFIVRNIRPAPREVVIPVQVHGSDVVRIGARGATGQDAQVSAPTSDGLVTSDCGVVIGVNTADCIPLVAVNEAARVVGVAHCGWRGVAAGVVESFLRELDAAAGSTGRGETRFLIGASVGPCCYEVGEDFLSSFSESEIAGCSVSRGGSTAFDLRRLVRARLAQDGIDQGSVFTDNTCTSCEGDTLASYRAEGDACGRMYTFLMILC